MINAKTGDFVSAGPIDGDLSLYGVITGFDAHNGFGIDIYDYGFPINYHVQNAERCTYSFIPEKQKNKYVVLSKEAYLEHLAKAEKLMDKRLKSKNLIAACWASRQHYLKGIIENIKNNAPEYKINDAPAPKTGVYVICKSRGNDPVRCSLSPEENDLEGLIVTPRYNPKDIAVIIAQLNPTNFGKVIPDQTSYNQCGSIMNARYFVYEIPEDAVDFVKNPFVLDLNLRRV